MTIGMTPNSTEERVALLEWSGTHGLSMGGSWRGVHSPSLVGYWVHDSLAATATRFKIVRMGVTKPVARARTLEAAKRTAQSHFEQSILSALTRTDNDVSGLGWQPIETAPKDGTEVLVAGGTRSHPDSMGGPEQFSGVSIARWSETWKQWDGESVSHDDCYSHDPTHWMPLPAPPALAKHRQSNGGEA